MGAIRGAHSSRLCRASAPRSPMAVERGEKLRPSKTLPSIALALALLLLCASAAWAGGKKEKQSSLERPRPPVEGIDMAVVGGDRFLTLTNKSGKVVLVKGYDDEPYLRFLASGVVQEN